MHLLGNGGARVLRHTIEPDSDATPAEKVSDFQQPRSTKRKMPWTFSPVLVRTYRGREIYH